MKSDILRKIITGLAILFGISFIIEVSWQLIQAEGIYSLFNLIFPLIGFALFKKYKSKKKQEAINQLKNEQSEALSNFIENKKLVPFKSLLSTDNSLKRLSTNFELDIDLAKNAVASQVNDFESALKMKMLNNYGAVTIKEKLFDYNYIDLSVIDAEVERLEQELPVSVNDLINDVERYNFQTRKEEKYAIEDKRVDLNAFYERQNEEINEILEFGCRHSGLLDFEKEIKRIKNLKYYTDYSIELPFAIEALEEKYLSADTTALDLYNTRVLKNSIYPSFVTKDFELHYKNDSKVLIVDYCLPNVDDVPTVKQINKQLNEVSLKEKEINALYELVLYQITLRTIYELFSSDKIDALSSIVFNGWVNYIDLADGNSKTGCIVSMQANKDEFMSVKLENVEPKICFKKFKGISCNNLATITPVKPILRVNTTDKRFVESYEVMMKLNEGDNLAMMDWVDFENLVREIFEKEFAGAGGEVKITQSSRDGGVDAIGYNPDPLLGGKIVIQAKRYTNVVPVSAVRDLYGTILNEGATKGILITTSHFGLDSYEFAKDKPITLIEGSNLLHLMEKHGHKARIDIQEAKALRNT